MGSDKKKSKETKDDSLTAEKRNPKAFSYQSINKVSRAVRRYLFLLNINILHNMFSISPELWM